jgi:F-type H+-transporting ATPase subunit delta
VGVAHRIYAHALLDAANEHGQLEAVHADLREFVAAVHTVDELRELLRNPRLDRTVKIAALRDLLGDANELVRNFVLVLVEKGRGAEVDEIAREFERLVAEEEGVLNVELTTAVELSDEEARELLANIERSSGRRVEATRKVDPELIGGIVLQAGSMRLDGSVRGRLDRLRRELVLR